MPPVDKLFGRGESAGKRYGFTTYDEDDIPRTELWRPKPKRSVALTKSHSLEPLLIITPMKVQQNEWTFSNKHFRANIFEQTFLNKHFRIKHFRIKT